MLHPLQMANGSGKLEALLAKTTSAQKQDLSASGAHCTL